MWQILARVYLSEFAMGLYVGLCCGSVTVWVFTYRFFQRHGVLPRRG